MKLAEKPLSSLSSMHSPFRKQLRPSSATDIIYELLDLSVCIPELKQLRQKLPLLSVGSLTCHKGSQGLVVCFQLRPSSASVNNLGLSVLQSHTQFKAAKTNLGGRFRTSLDQALLLVAAFFYVLHSPYLTQTRVKLLYILH